MKIESKIKGTSKALSGDFIIHVVFTSGKHSMSRKAFSYITVTEWVEPLYGFFPLAKAIYKIYIISNIYNKSDILRFIGQ